MTRFIRQLAVVGVALLFFADGTQSQRRGGGGGGRGGTRGASAQSRGSARSSVNRDAGRSASTRDANRSASSRDAYRSTNRDVNRGVNQNIDRDFNVNRGDVNIDIDRDIYVTGGYHGGYYGGYGGCCYHPAAGVAAVMVTAAVIGSIIYTLPPSCSTVIVTGLSYYQCGSTWYQPQFSGTTTTYIVVNAPG